MITKIELEEKVDNIQDQVDNIQGELDTMNREAVSFRSYVNRQFESIDMKMGGMATKEDLRNTEARLTKALTELSKTVTRIAEKVGVSL